MLQGGVRRARMEILATSSRSGLYPAARGLEVGIGAGENLRFLPADWTVYGVDIARTQLELCRDRHPEMAGRLAWAEAEDLPFDDATFDATWSIGGFNYYGDHERALREMRRVTKPGGPVVVADESPALHRAGLGHLIGMPSFDAWWLARLGLDRDFVEDGPELRRRPARALRTCLAPGTAHRIWHRLGYCVVETKRLPEITNPCPFLGDSSCQPPAPKKRRTSRRDSTSRMRISTGIARAVWQCPQCRSALRSTTPSPAALSCTACAAPLAD